MEAKSTASDHNPGPPKIASPGAVTEEDSQESMAVQNALHILSGTQSHSPEGGLSSPTGQGLGVQLLSRPQDVDVDPGESFSWGKPLKIVPGKFGRPAPTTSTVDTIQPKSHATFPFIIGEPGTNVPAAIVSGAVQATPHSSRQLGPGPSCLGVEEPSLSVHPSIESSLSSGDSNQPAGKAPERLLQAQPFARRHPFDDYQPRYQHPNGKNRTPNEKSFPRRLSTIQEGVINSETQDRDTHQAEGRVPHQVNQNQLESQPVNTIQIDIPRHRISLPNDTSVSPAPFSQQVLEKTSQHQDRGEEITQKSTGRTSPSLKLNRPMRDVRQVFKTVTPTHYSSSRSSRHGSNISKKRPRPRLPVSGRARPSRRHGSRHHDETPSIRRRYQQSGAAYRSPSLGGDRQSPGSPDMDVITGTFAGALNEYIGSMAIKWKRRDQDISYLEHNLRKKDEKLSNLRKESGGKAGRIQELESDRARIQEELDSVNQLLENRSTKMSELQRKCRTYKEHLNAAIVEQQDLYKASKAKCEIAIKQMREEEHKRMMLDEQQRKDLQSTSERLTQLVKSKVDEYSLKERELNNKLESLDQKLQERDADVERERETIRNLLEQNAAVQSVKDAVKAFEGQIEQINVKLGEIGSGQVERDGIAAEETRVKLGKIVAHLSALDKKVEPQETIIEKIKEANMQTFSAILNPVLELQTEFQTNLQKLSDAVNNYMEDFWIKLEDREDVLTELLEQTQTDNAQLQANVQLREEECNALLNRLEGAEAAVRQREKNLNDLRNELAQLERAQVNDTEQAARANSLEQNCERLKMDIAAKTAAARDFEIKLQRSQEACSKEREEHEKHTQELQGLMKQREETARAAQEAAVDVARQEVSRDMSVAKENISALLKQAEAERVSLRDELKLARQKASMVEETNRRATTTVDELRSELHTAQAHAKKVGEETCEKDREIVNAIESSSKQVANLEAKVADKEREIIRLSKDAETYDKQVKGALNSLREWTTGHRGVKEFVPELRNFQKGDVNGVDLKMKSFLEIDMLHQAIFQYCRSQGHSAPKCDKNAVEEPTIGVGDVWVDFPQSSPLGLLPTSDLATRVLDEVGRHVTIRSPNWSIPSPVPPSVSEEQEHRRSANPPKSIMKASSQGSPTEDGDLGGPTPVARSANPPSRGFFGRRTYKAFAPAKSVQEDRERRQLGIKDAGTLACSEFTRAPYNRPVSGTNPRAESDLPGDGARLRRDSKKRKQDDHQDLESHMSSGLETERVNARPLTKYVTPPEHQVSKGDDSQGLPGAPRKKAHKDPNSFIKLARPVHSLYFNQNEATEQHENTREGSNPRGARKRNSGGLKTSTPGTGSKSQDDSQESQSSDYPRRRSSRHNDNSQDPITHSQMSRREPSEEHYVPKWFTMN